MSRCLTLLVLLCLASPARATPALAQLTTDVNGTIVATISTQGGTVLLPGVLVLVRTPAGEPRAEQPSDGEGRATFVGLAPGAYRIRASLDGFDAAERGATVVAGGTAAIAIDLSITAMSEHVDVVGSSAVSTSGSLAVAETVSNTATQWLAPGGSVQSALRLLAAVIALPTGDSINGGRPGQAGYQIGAASLVDPATNEERIWLPADGVDTVQVLPNPYEAEFGRFASGLVVVQTRRAADRWKTAVNNTIPAFRTKRFTIANIEGLGAVKPSVEAGGPLVAHRIFVEQTAQYHWDATDVPSRPENELKTTQWFGSLTRVDMNLSPRHSLVATGGFDRSDASNATLGTFTPPDSTVDISDKVGYALVTERAVLNSTTVLESTFQHHAYDAGVQGQGMDMSPMVLRPDTTNGAFFNQQQRSTSTTQWVEAASVSRHWPGGLHLIKVGTDIVANSYDGTSASRPVLVARADGLLARRLDFSGPSRQEVHDMDATVFAQDRVQPSARWYVEYGARIDRDGIVGATSASPRLGTALMLNAAATAVLRGGYGLFYERTPSVASAFASFETATDSRFAADGVTLVAKPMAVTRIVDDLRAAHSATWDLAYDYRMSPRWAFHLGVLDRQGRHELTINPVFDANGEAIVLSSAGRSSYLREELGVHVTRGSRMDVNASYVHASAHENLNALVSLYGAVLVPVVGADEYAQAASDAPNRLFVRGQAMPTTRWMLVGTFDWRSGLPYSAFNEQLEFVGPRNTRRFPTFVRTELGLDRRIAVGHVHPWLGVRAANALSAFLPTDVQANLASSAFGSFYNSEYRQIRIHVRFER